MKDNDLRSPLCIIIDGIFDVESFYDQFPIFEKHEQKIIQIWSKKKNQLLLQVMKYFQNHSMFKLHQNFQGNTYMNFLILQN